MLDTYARKYMQPNLDISFVRVVEVSMIVALACIYPDARFLLVILAGVIVFTMAQRALPRVPDFISRRGPECIRRIARYSKGKSV